MCDLQFNMEMSMISISDKVTCPADATVVSVL